MSSITRSTYTSPQNTVLLDEGMGLESNLTSFNNVEVYICKKLFDHKINIPCVAVRGVEYLFIFLVLGIFIVYLIKNKKI